MKKIVVILLAILSGAILSITTLLYTQKKEERSEFNEFYVLQLGTYENKVNALQKSEEYPSAIFEKDGFYLVLAGVSFHENSLQRLEDSLTKKGISYYKKKLKLKVSSIEDFKKYELFLGKEIQETTLEYLNLKMLGSVEI